MRRINHAAEHTGSCCWGKGYIRQRIITQFVLCVSTISHQIITSEDLSPPRHQGHVNHRW